MKNLTVTIVAGAYDSQNGLYLKGYPNNKELYKGNFGSFSKFGSTGI